MHLLNFTQRVYWTDRMVCIIRLNDNIIIVVIEEPQFVGHVDAFLRVCVCVCAYE